MHNLKTRSYKFVAGLGYLEKHKLDAVDLFLEINARVLVGGEAIILEPEEL